jgi:hypothetical protein
MCDVLYCGGVKACVFATLSLCQRRGGLEHTDWSGRKWTIVETSTVRLVDGILSMVPAVVLTCNGDRDLRYVISMDSSHTFRDLIQSHGRAGVDNIIRYVEQNVDPTARPDGDDIPPY